MSVVSNTLTSESAPSFTIVSKVNKYENLRRPYRYECNVVLKCYANMHELLVWMSNIPGGDSCPDTGDSYNNCFDPNEPRSNLDVTYESDYREGSTDINVYKRICNTTPPTVYFYDGLENYLDDWYEDFEQTGQYINTNDAKFLLRDDEKTK